MSANTKIPSAAGGPEHGFQRAYSIVTFATRPLAFVGVAGMLVAALATVIDVLLRWLTTFGVAGLNEIIAMVFAVAVTACMPAGLAGGVNLKIDLLARWIRGRLAAGMDAFGAFLLLVFFGLLTWRVWLFADSLLEQGRTTVILGWPMPPFMFTAAAFLAYGTLVQAAVTVAAVRKAVLYSLSARDSEPSVLLTVVVSGMCILLVSFAAYCAYDFVTVSRWVQANVGVSVTIIFVFMWLLMLSLIPLAAIMGLAGIFCSALFIGVQPALSAFAAEATGFLTNSQVATLPLFLMMGSFAAVSGLSNDLYRLAQVLLSRFRGGLALATIGGCAGFGALTGSSLATAAMIGRVAIPEMRARGYSPALATGCCAAGGTLGPIVPPGSGPIIVFALLTDASIGRLFVASIGPAILTIAFYFIVVMLYVRIARGAAPPATDPHAGELGAALRRSIPVGILVFTVMGGLYLGIFTDTESAAVGAVGAVICAAWRGKFGRNEFLDVMIETTATTAMIYGLIFGASIFSFFVSISALTEAATAFATSLQYPPALMIAVIILCYLLLGSLMEAFAVMVITVPVVTPLVVGLGYDIVWWGIIMMMVIEIGMIHPPLGLNVLILKTLTPDVPLGTIYKGVLPFCFADLIKLIILVLFPAITLWLPSTMR